MLLEYSLLLNIRMDEKKKKSKEADHKKLLNFM